MESWFSRYKKIHYFQILFAGRAKQGVYFYLYIIQTIIYFSSETDFIVQHVLAASFK